MSRPRRLWVLAALGGLAGCGSTPDASLPAPAGAPVSPPLRGAPAGQVTPAHVASAVAPVRTARLGDGRLLRLDARARAVELLDGVTGARLGRAPAGVGPTTVACLSRGPCYVADTTGDALLVYAVAPRLELVRRARLAGGPYAMAIDAARRRLYVTLPRVNRVAEVPAHRRPHVLRTWPTVRQPDAILVDERSGQVAIVGAGRAVRQWLPG